MAEVRERGGSKKQELIDLLEAAADYSNNNLNDDNAYSEPRFPVQLSCVPLRGLDEDFDEDGYRHSFKFIEHGYRRGYSLWELFLSLGQFHNETSNIWSHLIGFFCILFVGMQKWVEYENKSSSAGSSSVLSSSLMSSSNSLISGSENGGVYSAWGDFFFEVYIFCAAACLALSFTYHWFGCFSEVYHRNLLRLDLTGVGLLVAGSFFPSMFLNFHCTPDLQQRYLLLSLFVLIVGLIIPWAEIKVNGNYIRHYIFALLVVIGLIPCGHWALITPRVYKDSLMASIALLFFWYGLGFFFFVSRIPERFYPKSIIATMIIPSHSLWHLCVVAAIYVWFGHIIASQQLLAKLGCEPYHQNSNIA